MEKVTHHVPNLRFPGYKGAWKNVSLEDATSKTISYGIVQAGEHVEDGMPYIKSIDLNEELNLDRLQRTSMAIAHKYRRSEVRPGDIVFSLRGNIGVSQIVPSSIEVANLTQGTARISVSKDHSNVFVRTALQTEKVIKHVLAVMKGSTFQEISLGDLREVEIYVPTLPEQQKIAAFLGAVDRKIQQLKRKQALLEQYKKGMVQRLFSQELRFKREDGSAYPEWEEKRLGDVVTFTKGKGVSKGDIVEGGVTKCIRYGELYTTYGEVINEVVSATNADPSQLLLSKKNDVIIPSSGETQVDIAKASCVMHDGIALGGDLNVMRTKENGVFLAYYLNGAKRNAIAEMAQGNSVVHLYSKQLQGISIELPSLEEQSRIAGFLMALDAKVAGVAKAVATAEKWKKGLLQQMFV